MMRYLLATLLVFVTVVEVSGYLGDYTKYRDAYDLPLKPKYRFYQKFLFESPLHGKYRIYGHTYTLPSVVTHAILITKESIPFWFSEKVINTYHYVDGSPLKMTTLSKNGSLEVRYLGDKLDKNCKHLNCQLELSFLQDEFDKKELVDRSGFSFILAVVTPCPAGVRRSPILKPDKKLQCELDH